MARIPAVEIERLKDEISLERLVTAAGTELKKAGVDLIGCCPFHADKTPSLVKPRFPIAPIDRHSCPTTIAHGWQ